MVHCRVNKFLEWIQDKNRFDGVTMIRLVLNGKAHDYTRWKFSGMNIFFYDQNGKVETILWTSEKVKVIDDNTIVINEDHGSCAIGLELFYGGAIL
jgi:hypothetical protein